MKNKLYILIITTLFSTGVFALENHSFWNLNNLKKEKENRITTNPPTGNTTQTFCAGATLSSIQVTGANIKWYSTASGGSALSNTTLLVNYTSYYASQTVSGVESTSRLQVTVVVISTPIPTIIVQQNCTSLGTIQITSPLSVLQILPTDLFISEFTDSNTGGLSYVEIYNGTGNTVNLSNYTLKTASNGNAYSFTLPLNNVMLANNAKYVVALGNDSSCSSIPGGDGSYASQTSGSGSVNFVPNGNDHIGLFNGSTLIDSWGIYGSNSWAPTFIGSEGSDFRRKNNISPLPNPTYNNNDWDIFDYAGNVCVNNDYTNVGTYSLNTGVNYQYNVDGGAYQLSTIFSGLAPGTHIVNVQDTATGCISSSTAIINPNPVANIPNDYHVCDDNTNGIGVFDLVGVLIPQVLGTTLPAWNYTVLFYNSLANAQAGTPIISPSNAFITANTTIWIRVENNVTGCFDIVTVNLIVDSKPQPTLPTSSYIICDSNQDGISSFDLNTLTPNFLIGAPELYTISYYLTSSDAESGSNSIDLSIPFINSNSPFQQFLWVRAENPATHCFTVIQIELEVNPSPIMPTNLSNIVLCDSDSNTSDGCTSFDLNIQNLTILAAQVFPPTNSYFVTYYTNQADASASDLNLNPIINTSNYYSCGNTTIWVRIESSVTHCFAVGSFHLIAIPIPSDPVITLVGNVLYSNASSGNQWYDQNGAILGAIGTSFTLPSSGQYGCQVQNGDCWSNIVYNNYTLGTERFIESNFSLFPNPSSEQIIVLIPSSLLNNSISYTISDITGKMLLEGNLKSENTPINTSHIENGVYFILFKSKDKQIVKKIIKR
jgi:hypothetical protein